VHSTPIRTAPLASVRADDPPPHAPDPPDYAEVVAGSDGADIAAVVDGVGADIASVDSVGAEIASVDGVGAAVELLGSGAATAAALGTVYVAEAVAPSGVSAAGPALGGGGEAGTGNGAAARADAALLASAHTPAVLRIVARLAAAAEGATVCADLLSMDVRAKSSAPSVVRRDRGAAVPLPVGHFRPHPASRCCAR
jgi:hypothetical protein